MFLAIVFIAIGLAILLNAMGVLNGAFWGFFWGIFFLAVGIKMIIRKGGCPICSGHWWKDKMHGHCYDGDHHHDEHNQ